MILDVLKKAAGEDWGGNLVAGLSEELKVP